MIALGRAVSIWGMPVSVGLEFGLGKDLQFWMTRRNGSSRPGRVSIPGHMVKGRNGVQTMIL